MNDDSRFINLESKIAHQEFQLEELSQVLYNQQQQIDLLQKQLSHIHKRLQDVTPSPDIGPANEKPPHY
ncbi:SlyX family protein [Pseudobdellovibrio exovorus]|nr:SlyX family protein [Pseudobdellovibrio exovorus]